MLAASETGMAEGTINATYSDGSTISNPLLVPAWWTWPYPAGGDLIFPFYYSSQSINYNRSNIYQTVNWLDTSTDITSLFLPNITGGSETEPGGNDVETRLHIFSLTLWPAIEANEGSSPSLEVQYARSTNKWLHETDKTQIVEVLVSNVGESGWVLSNNTVTVEVISDGLKTVQPGVVKRLRPGDQAIVEVGVVNQCGFGPGETGEATVVLSGINVNVSYSFEAAYGIADYDPTYESIYAHESPSWYNGAKYGIFIHWGVYSVPGWGNSGDNETYAEWYAMDPE
jgi:alpha-L-fucosidase